MESLNTHLLKLSERVSTAIDSKQWEEAIEHIELLLSIIPKHYPALKDLAFCKRKNNQLTESYEIIQQILADQHDYIDAIDSCVCVCFAMHRYEEAHMYAQRSLTLKKQSAEQSCIFPLPDTQVPRISTNKEENIISFSLFGESPRYCETAVLNAELAQTIYPSWTCRFYVDKSVPKHVITRLHNLGAQIHYIDSDTQKYSGLFWRFFVMDDPTVRCFIIRDADSLLSYKEKAAVDEWLASGTYFHIMRAAIEHSELILAGMWGALLEYFLI